MSFVCEICCFSTSHKGTYTRHVQTEKHLLLAENQRLRRENEELRNTIKELSTRTITNNITIHNYNNIVVQPITFNIHFDQVVPIPLLLQGCSIYEHFVDMFFCDENGNFKIECTNRAQRVFQYMLDGKMVSDEGLQKFSTRFREEYAPNWPTLKQALQNYDHKNIREYGSKIFLLIAKLHSKDIVKFKKKDKYKWLVDFPSFMVSKVYKPRQTT